MRTPVDGHVYAWGSGLSGQLGNGTQDSAAVPTRMVVEGSKPLKAFSARGGEYDPPPLASILLFFTIAPRLLVSCSLQVSHRRAVRHRAFVCVPPLKHALLFGTNLMARKGTPAAPTAAVSSAWNTRR